jgi:ABC-type amino acid transport substrate-binding protein
MRRRDFIKAIAGSTVVQPLAAGAAALPAMSSIASALDTPTFITLVPGKLTVCTYGGFAPVCYKKDGQLVGLDVSFLTKFAVQERREIVLIERDFNDIWTMPGKNVCDIAAAGIMRRAERKVAPGGSWSEPYFEVKRSLLVRTDDKTAFNNYATLRGKNIVVTQGSTADIDAKTRYPNCKIEYVDQVAKGQKDPQAYIVKELIGKKWADAFGEGDISNKYLLDQYGQDVPGGLALADVHPIAGPEKETFNFITRDASIGVLDALNVFIAANEGAYAQ